VLPNIAYLKRRQLRNPRAYVYAQQKKAFIPHCVLPAKRLADSLNLIWRQGARAFHYSFPPEVLLFTP
jgi:hypothetical protein